MTEKKKRGPGRPAKIGTRREFLLSAAAVEALKTIRVRHGLKSLTAAVEFAAAHCENATRNAIRAEAEE